MQKIKGENLLGLKMKACPKITQWRYWTLAVVGASYWKIKIYIMSKGGYDWLVLLACFGVDLTIERVKNTHPLMDLAMSLCSDRAHSLWWDDYRQARHVLTHTHTLFRHGWQNVWSCTNITALLLMAAFSNDFWWVTHGVRCFLVFLGN